MVAWGVCSVINLVILFLTDFSEKKGDIESAHGHMNHFMVLMVLYCVIIAPVVTLLYIVEYFTGSMGKED